MLNTHKSRSIPFFALSILFFTIQAHAQFHSSEGSIGSDCDNIAPIASTTELSYVDDIQPIFDFNQCVSCHGSAAGLSLEAPDSYDNIVGVATTASTGGLNRIEPGDPSQSFLFLKVNCESPGAGTSRMPLGSPTPLNALLQKKIEDWINQGTPWFKSGFEDQ